MKVLIGVDGSEGSFAAVQLAGQMLSESRDNILLYYCPPQVAVTGGSRPDAKTLELARQALATAVFEEAKSRVDEPLRQCIETTISSDKPAHGLLETAANQQADMIVVGARGVGPIERLVLGSVSREVIHHTTLPVLVARPRSEEASHEGLRVLLACDGTESGGHVGDFLHGFTWSQDSVGRIVSVVESLFAGQLPTWLEEQARDSETELLSKAWVEETEADLKRVGEEMTALGQKLPDIFHGQTPIVVEGHPSEKILETARAEGTDLVVVGAHNQGALSRLLIGSTSQALLGHAPCSVLMVPQPTS